MSDSRRATCLGCGCTCDDLLVSIEHDRIAGVNVTCDLALEWFGTGECPAEARVNGRRTTLAAAITSAAGHLLQAARPRVFIGEDLSCEAQRTAVALADLMRATVDTTTGRHASAAVSATQRMGKLSATLGEFRARADLLVFWGVDPDARFPRLRSRYLPCPASTRGNGTRTSVSVDVGARRGPGDVPRRIAVTPGEELTVLSQTAALLSGTSSGGGLMAADELARTIRDAGYVCVVVDGESGGSPAASLTASALTMLARGINDVTRGGLCTLRGGGNRSGADAVLTWQTGYPMHVDFSRGHPRHGIAGGDAPDVVLSVGRADHGGSPGTANRIAIGPFATRSGADIAIDTGVAGIHEQGLAYRMDDVPVPLHALLPGPPATRDVLDQLLGQCRSLR